MSADDPRDPDNEPEYGLGIFARTPVPETVSEVAQRIVSCLKAAVGHSGEVTTPEQVAEQTKDAPMFANAEPGWDLGQAFLGVRLPNGTEISIALGVTE